MKRILIQAVLLSAIVPVMARYWPRIPPLHPRITYGKIVTHFLSPETTAKAYYKKGANDALDTIMLLALEQRLEGTNRPWGTMAEIVCCRLRVKRSPIAATFKAAVPTETVWMPVEDTVITYFTPVPNDPYSPAGIAQHIGPQPVASFVRSNVVYQLGLREDGVVVWRKESGW